MPKGGTMGDNNFNIWIAGFWEGEGSIFQQKHRNYIITISQSINSKRTVERLMEKIQKIYGGYIIRVNFKNKNYKSQLQWRLYKREDVIRFINIIYPYCQIRKQNLKDALTYFENNPSLKIKKIIDLEKVKELFNIGKTREQIGKIFNVASSTIYKRYSNKSYRYYKKKSSLLINVH